MRQKLARLRDWAAANLRSLLATVAFAAVCVGLWRISENVALIVGGGIVFLALVVGYVRGE